MSSRKLTLPTLALILSLAPLQAAPTPKAPPKEPRIEQIRKVLDSTVSLEYSQITLAAVLNQLSDDHKVQFVLDKGALNMLGFDENSLLIETKQKDVKLKTGLKNLLNAYGLTTAIVGDQVLVTTEEIALYKQFKQRINLDYSDAPFHKIVKELSLQYGVNIVLDPKCVKAKTTEAAVTLQLDDVAFEAAVRLLCEMAGLKAARLSNVIYITTEERADKLNKESELVPNPNPNFPNGVAPNPMALLPGFGGLIPAIPAPAAPAAPAAKEAPKE